MLRQFSCRHARILPEECQDPLLIAGQPFSDLFPQGAKGLFFAQSCDL